MAIPLPKQGKKNFVAIPLPKMGGKKNNGCRNLGRNFKKTDTFTIFLQHFNNKSQVISYYQFKFEFDTEITFLIQQ